MTMKKTSVLLFAAAVMLSSCGIMSQQSSTGNGHQFQDGIYSSSPSFISKDEKEVSQKKTEELVQKTKSSEIYLLGETKDTIMIPENMSARIQFGQKVGGTVVTVGENPYDWRWDLAGSSWYWGRYYSPYWSSWGYSPWHYNPWYSSSWSFSFGYYGGLYGYYDPWYYRSWYGWNWGWNFGWNYGWNYGCYNPWHHHYHYGWYNPPHYHGPSHGPGHIIAGPGGHKDRYTAPRAHTNGSSLRRNDARKQGSQGVSASRTSTTARRGIGTSSSISRNSTVSRGTSSSTSRAASGSRSGSATYRRPVSSTSSSSSANQSSGSGYSRSAGSTYNRPSGNSGSYERSSGSYSRSSSPASSGGYSRSSSSSGRGYSRSSSSGSYRR